MKKILIIFLCLFFSCSAYARDFTKIQEKEMKHAQKHETVSTYLQYNKLNKTNIYTSLFDDYKVTPIQYIEKLNKDNTKYSEIKEKFETRTIDNYNAEAKGEDYYHIYRIAEKIIRANKLDYMNWKIEIYRSSGKPEVTYKNLNYICIPTSLYDTFSGNDSAIAFSIAHVMSHSILGHRARLDNFKTKMYRTACFDFTGWIFFTMCRRHIIEEKNTEFAADVEALNLIARAGYNLNNAMEYLVYFKAYETNGDFWSEDPNVKKRISNCETAIKFIPTEKFKELGEYNLYTTDVLKAELSSDRASFTMIKPSARPKDQYYHPETPQEYYLRCGYGGYVNGYYEKSCEYFEKYFKLNTSNSQAYYYASLANEQMYKKTHKNIYKTRTQNYAQKSNSLVPSKL